MNTQKKAERILKALQKGDGKHECYLPSQKKAQQIVFRLVDLLSEERVKGVGYTEHGTRGRYKGARRSVTHITSECGGLCSFHYDCSTHRASFTLPSAEDPKESRTGDTNKETLLLQGLHVRSQEDEQVRNPYSGATATLSPVAVALHDYIKGCEVTGRYKDMETALDIFRKRWPEAYMTLLD